MSRNYEVKVTTHVKHLTRMPLVLVQELRKWVYRRKIIYSEKYVEDILKKKYDSLVLRRILSVVCNFAF